MLLLKEQTECNLISERLGIEVITDDTTEGALDRFRLMWRIAHGEPPTIDVPINLQRGEVCYFATDTTWSEMRRQTRRVRYAGPTMRLKICKGVYWRMGDLAFQPVSNDVLTTIDQGTIFITNKRVLFMGDMKNRSIRLQKILDITPYRDGVMIDKDAGKSPFLGFSENIDLMAACLARALQDLS